MALNFQTVAVPFTGGLETKSDEKTVLPTKLTVLENGEFTKRGTVRARPGHLAMQNATVAGTTILGVASPAPVGIKLGHATRADELLLLTDERIYSADEGTKRWMARGQHYPLTHTADELAQVNANQSYAGVATAGVVRAVCWVDSRGGVRYSVYNEATGAAYVLDQAVAGGTTTSRPWVVPVGDNVVLLWADHSSNSIQGLLVRSANVMASLAAAAVEFVGDLDSSRRYAVTTDGTDLYFAYYSDGLVVTAGVAGARVTPFATTIWKRSVSTDAPVCLDVAYSVSGSNLSYCWYDATAVKRAKVFNTGAVGASVNISTPIVNVVKVATGETVVGDFSYAWEVDAASDDLNTVTITDTVGATATIRHSYLASSGFTLKADGRCVFVLGHASRTGLQGAYYLYTDESLVIGQALYQSASSRPTLDHLSRCFNLELALGFKRQLDAEGTTAVFTHDGISRVVLSPLAKPSYAEAGGTAYLSGSCLWAYDGQAVTEANCLMYPDILAADASQLNVGGTRLTALNQYSYRVYYEFTRANGERVRSASLVISVTLTGGNDTISLAIPTLTHTRWRGDVAEDEARLNATVTVFRTIGNDTTGIYYKVSGNDPSVITGDNRYIYNNPAGDVVVFVDAMADADLLDGEVDYLTRGEIEHLAPPGPAIVCSVADRLFLAGGAVPRGTIRYSKLRFFGEPAEFGDTTLVIDDLPESPGDITALSYVNETLIALRQYGLSAVGGIGLDNTGTSGAYESQAITTDVGCSGVAVVTPAGVMFTSTKGIYLLSQSLDVVYIGAAVERYNAQTYTGGCVIPGTNQVLFTSNAGRSLMFDYAITEGGEWAAWTILADSLVVWKQTTPTILRTADGATLYRDTSPYLEAVFTDAGSTYPFKMRTGPLRLTDCLQDFARLKRFQILGTYRSAHRLLISLYYDRDTAPYEIITWDPATVIVNSTWGSDATWGSGDVWGGTRDGANYQFEHKPMRQKFSTIRFEFSMIPGTTPGAGYELTELALLCGVKPGLQRHGASRKY